MMNFITTTDKRIISKICRDEAFWKSRLYFFQELYDLKPEEMKETLSFDPSTTTPDMKNLDLLLFNPEVKAFEFSPGFKTTPFQVKKIELDIIDSATLGQLIYWQDWTYTFSKKENQFHLWVYLGGIAEMAREITLADSQIESFKEKGKPYIERLVGQLSTFESEVYAQAIADKRRLI